MVDFSLDIVEIDGKPKAKRGKRSGEKQVYQMRDGTHKVLPISHKKPKGARALIERFKTDGRAVKQSGMQDARLRVLGQVKDLPHIQSLLKKRDPASLMNR